MIHLLSANDMPPDLGWLRLVAEGGSLIIVAWVVYWILSKVIPDMNKQHAETMKEQREDHLKAQEDQRKEHSDLTDRSRKDFLNAMADQRKDFTEQLTREREMCASLAAAVSKCVDRIERHDNDMKLAHARELERLEEVTLEHQD